MDIKDVVGKKQFTAVMEYDISLKSSEDGFEYRSKPNKKILKRLMKGVKLTSRYLTKMDKYGYKIENCEFGKKDYHYTDNV